MNRIFIALITVSLNSMLLCMQPTSLVKAPAINEPASQIYYLETRNGQKFIVDRSLIQLCSTLEQYVSDFDASLGTSSEPIPLSDQINPAAFGAWISCLKKIKENPKLHMTRLREHLELLPDQQLIDTIDTAHYFELNKEKMAALIGSAKPYASSVIETPAIDIFFRRFRTASRESCEQKLSALPINESLNARLLTRAALNPSTIHEFDTTNHSCSNIAPMWGYITSIGYRPDGRQLAASNNHHLYLIDSATLNRTAHITIPNSPDQGLALVYSPDGLTVGFCYANGLMFADSSLIGTDVRWDNILYNESKLRQILLPAHPTTLTYHPQGNQVAVGTYCGLYLLDNQTHKLTTSTSYAAIHAVKYHPFYNHLYASNALATVRKYDVNTLQNEQFYSISLNNRIDSVDISPDGSLAAITHNGVTLVDVKLHKGITSYAAALQPVSSAAFNPCAPFLSFVIPQFAQSRKDRETNFPNSSIQVFDLRMHKLLMQLASGVQHAHSNVVFNPAGTHLTYGNDTGHLYTCDLTGNKPSTLVQACLNEGIYHGNPHS